MLHRRELQEKNIQVTVSIYPDDLTLSADKNMIEQVLINLLKNAIQAFEDPDERRIEIHS